MIEYLKNNSEHLKQIGWFLCTYVGLCAFSMLGATFYSLDDTRQGLKSSAIEQKVIDTPIPDSLTFK